MGQVDGKVALVSGGANGMGASHARALVAAGASVVVGDVVAADDLVAELGDRARSVRFDVTEPAGWDAAVATAVDTFGGLDVLVDNAGIVNFGPTGTYTHDAWARTMAINLTGVFNGIIAATEALKRSGERGSIINVSSTAGLIAFVNVPGHMVSRWGCAGSPRPSPWTWGPAACGATPSTRGHPHCDHEGRGREPRARGPAPHR